MSTRQRVPWVGTLALLALFTLATLPAWGLRKNVASQEQVCALLLTTAGAAHTSGTTTVYYHPTGTTQTSDGTATHSANGVWCISPSQTATNNDTVKLLWLNAGAVPVLQTYVTTEPQTGDAYARLGAPAGASIAADLVTLDNFIDTEVADILADTGTDGVVVAAASKTGYTLTATTGLGNQTANITGNLSGSVGSVTGAVGSVTGAVGSVTGLTPATIADGVWDEPYTGHATDDTYGLMFHPLAHGTVAGVGASTITLDGDAAATNNYYDGAIVQILTGTGAGQSRIISSYVGATKVATLTEAWATQPNGASKYSILPLGDVEVGVVHTGAIVAGSFAAGAINAAAVAAGAIDAATFAADVDAEIAAMVLNAAVASYGGAGTYGQAVEDVLADTDVLQTDWANGGRLDLILDAASAPSAATVADAVWDEALSGHSAAGTAGLALATASSGGVDPSVLADAIWDEALTGHSTAGTTGLMLGTTIPAAVDAVPTVSEFNARSLVAADYTIVSDLGTVQSADHTAAIADIPTVAEFTARTAPTTSGAGAEFTAAALVNAPAGGGGATAGEIADAVWDETLASHAGVGSAGAALAGAGSAGDPWSTPLPGSYADGTAGAALVTRAAEATVLAQFGVTWGTTYPLVNRDGIINVPRGDVYTISTTLGADFPLTGRTVYFIGQKRKADANTTAIVNRAMTITSVPNRTCTITLTAAETATAGQYLYEIEVRDTTTEANPSTAESGTLNIIEDLRK
jgi:hypothetical protein